MTKNISRIRLLLILLLGFLFWMITNAVIFQHSTTHWDLYIGQWFVTQTTQPGLRIANFITSLGSYFVVRDLSIPVGLWLLYKRDWKRLIMFGLLMVVTVLIAPPLKELIARARPPLPLDSLYGSRDSYPSGHTFLGTVFYTMLAYLTGVYARRTWLKIAGIGLSIAIILLIGFSRVYLEMHYLTDVFGGWTAGALLFFFFLFLKDISFSGRRQASGEATRTRAN